MEASCSLWCCVQASDTNRSLPQQRRTCLIPPSYQYLALQCMFKHLGLDSSSTVPVTILYSPSAKVKYSSFNTSLFVIWSLHKVCPVNLLISVLEHQRTHLQPSWKNCYQLIDASTACSGGNRFDHRPVKKILTCTDRLQSPNFTRSHICITPFCFIIGLVVCGLKVENQQFFTTYVGQIVSHQFELYPCWDRKEDVFSIAPNDSAHVNTRKLEEEVRCSQEEVIIRVLAPPSDVIEAPVRAS